ncbi:RNA 2',3'-cyclic phosphodiesterase [Thermomonospora catenispora]|uniref:RNA 2',3'-cyclic phosphodiesterase n=1 Tax=Thermomonospora catenispora TaxID=2493090 RepID=UPI00111EE5CD|nr:RNA 2',3'-cyclic phosphodiesterase [Thermomonospora catenispora]TNY35609.1 RNA 2',3'-cyclic phosphodiesterase [Thermomonospora catenispora]
MRLFAALLPPPDVLEELDRLLEPYRSAWPDLRWVDRDLMHITLAFYGELDERTTDRLLPRLERAAGRYPAIELSFAGAGAFPGGAHARVLWTGVYGDRGVLSRLAASVNAAGRRAGVRLREYRGFRPHVTLARSRRPMDLRPLVEELSAYAGATWTADALHLVRSHLPGGRDRRLWYEPVHRWPLR